MWRRIQGHSRAAAATNMHPSAGPYGGQFTGSKTVVADDKVVFMALGTFFGLIFLLFGIQIYVRCVWRRIQASVNELEDESEEVVTTREVHIREVGGRRNWRRRLHHYFDERSESSSPAQNVAVGLEKSVLELLPTFLFNTNSAFADEMVCAVCLEQFLEGEVGRILPKCTHCFHVLCIDMWFLSHSSCPLCRCEVSAPSQESMSDPLLQTSRSCPDFSQLPLALSDQQQQEQDSWPSASAESEVRDPSQPEESAAVPFSPGHAIMIPQSASIVVAHSSNDAQCSEQRSSLSERYISLEISSGESIVSITDEDHQSTSSELAEVELVIMRADSSSEISSPGSEHRSSSSSNPFLDFEPELHPPTTREQTRQALSDRGFTTNFTTPSCSPHHAKTRSLSAVETSGEYDLDTSGTTSPEDLSPVVQGRF